MKLQIADCPAAMTAMLSRAESVGSAVTLETEDDSISYAPDGQHAVILLARRELFIAVRLEFVADGCIRCQYVDHCTWYDDDPALRALRVEWGWMRYGFCKLVLWAPEQANRHGGDFDHTLHRFYFDRPLYERMRKQLHADKPDQ